MSSFEGKICKDNKVATEIDENGHSDRNIDYENVRSENFDAANQKILTRCSVSQTFVATRWQ